MFQISKIPSFFFLSIILLTFACEPTTTTLDTKPNNGTAENNTNTDIAASTEYDSILAQRLGADDYGMKPYVLALLKAGPNKIEDKAVAQKLFMGHMANIKRLEAEGSLVVAGPFYGEEIGDLQGLYIFNVESVEAARALTNTDPAIQAGSLVMELYPWYGSAAMLEINKIHKTIIKKNITE